MARSTCGLQGALSLCGKLGAEFEMNICGVRRKYKVVPPSLQNSVKRVARPGGNIQHAAKRQKVIQRSGEEEQTEDQ